MAKSRGTALSIDQALLTVLLAAANANQHVSPAEAERAYHIIWFMKRFRRKSGEAVDRLILGVRDRLESEGEDVLLARSARVLSASLRLSAFAVAVDLMLADGRIEASERGFIRRLAAALKLPRDRADEIVRVMRIKNAA